MDKRLTFNVWVEPVLAQGRGIPFSPRTMYAVRYALEGDLPRPYYEAYWSRRLANRIAEEKARVMKAQIENFLWGSLVR